MMEPASLPPYTAENWIEQYADLGNAADHSMLLGYMDCLDRVLPVLGKIVETATNFDELKTELLKFNQQQKDFLADVEAKWLNNKYDPPCGLPYMG